ncbi:hypothetical protein VaNZ11_014226 [Volvox africanus]|uniref:Rhodanese domain-containing protein n=1 Tax=Volvox africanus TaxID=51714 RepID=A0ABQ5SID3_9CHLO|nr:hypothetical protein VaNZ11_014226 [Volvox africanus]
MPAVINVGGPVAWGLVVFVSAWAIRTGRALAGRRRARRKELEDETLLHDPNADQPQYLQRLTATAIRMLIEAGPLPCAVIELADGGSTVSASTAARNLPRGVGHHTSGSSQAQDTNPWGGTTAASSRQTTAAAASFPSTRIAPPELSGVVPCLPVTAWVRALASAEAWRMELVRAAATAAASPEATACVHPHLLHVSSHGSPVFRDGSNGNSGIRGRRSPQPARANASVPGGCAGDGSGSRLNGHHASSAAGAAEGFVGCISGAGYALAATTATAAGAAGAASMALLPYPPRHGLLVVLGGSGRAVEVVTAAAAKAGFSRVGTWVGSADFFASTSLSGPRLPSISRHALWLMLQLGPEPRFFVPSLVLDVRRPDERLSYGAIRGTVNIPADELAAALALPPGEFLRRYGTPRPGPCDVVVLHSRLGRRAAWAAQVCVDAGLERVLVYGDGVYGWRLEDRVKPYRAYDLGAPPPDPEPFTPEEPDEATGLEELHRLGLPMRQGLRPSRFSVLSPLNGGVMPVAPASVPATSAAIPAGAGAPGAAAASDIPAANIP